ncbi:hypothetical protein DDI_2813 [Dickeya dianthicola RNS04.9]|nr:hypothetical protein DDI_2813 [Dickeya dianthicola RNS04.9]
MKRRFTIMMLAFLFVSVPIGSSDKGWASSALGGKRERSLYRHHCGYADVWQDKK